MNDNETASYKDEMEKLHRQVEFSGMFTHSMLTQLATRSNESESFLYAVIDLMIDKGLITQQEMIDTVHQIRNEMVEKQETVNTGVAIRVDGDGDDEYTPVNCLDRWPICKSICCKLDFALNADEVESGKIKWDMGRPYYIRHEKNCFCSHFDVENTRCGVYQDRPAVCKKYTCAQDTRIWKDFEKMELNHEWLNQYLKEVKPRLVDVPMFTDQKIVYKKE